MHRSVIAWREAGMDGRIVRERDWTSGISSARDVLLLALDDGERSLRKTLADITDEEYGWEPLPESERASDLLLPPRTKRVWRVFQQGGVWTYDYTPEELHPAPFTTIAWIMNHVAQSADMYLYCIESAKPEGVDRKWEDLPVPPNRYEMGRYIYAVLARARDYLLAIPEERVLLELNKPAPAPWGELRPVYRNIWGGIVEHVIQHEMQIGARKDRIRYGY